MRVGTAAMIIMPECDVAIIGAGPYGLSAAAHLRAADGLETRVFGEPMSFWDRHMPKGMLLRSPLAGSHLSDPARELTLQCYEAASGQPITAPLPLQRFADYGRWFQSRAVPDVDCRTVDRLDRSEQGFQLTLADGESYRARRVIVAAGIAPFAWYPPVFRRLPSALASHACEYRDLGGFAGKKLAVVGAGQSALESAALLSETGADVEVLVRASSAGSGGGRGFTRSWQWSASCTPRPTSDRRASATSSRDQICSDTCLVRFRIGLAGVPSGRPARRG